MKSARSNMSVPGPHPDFEDCLPRRQSHPFQHEPFARLDACGLLRFIHELDEEVRILGAVDLREKLGMRLGTHADPPASAALASFLVLSIFLIGAHYRRVGAVSSFGEAEWPRDDLLNIAEVRRRGRAQVVRPATPARTRHMKS